MRPEAPTPRTPRSRAVLAAHIECQTDATAGAARCSLADGFASSTLPPRKKRTPGKTREKNSRRSSRARMRLFHFLCLFWGQMQYFPPECRELYLKIARRSIQKDVIAEQFFSPNGRTARTMAIPGLAAASHTLSWLVS